MVAGVNGLIWCHRWMNCTARVATGGGVVAFFVVEPVLLIIIMAAWVEGCSRDGGQHTLYFVTDDDSVDDCVLRLAFVWHSSPRDVLTNSHR
jgi:hypothetical protein